MTDAPTNVVAAIARVMVELPAIGKDGQASAQQGGYAYRGIEAITGAAQSLLGKYGVVFVPKVTDRRTIEFSVNSKPWTEEQLTVVYTVYGPGGVDDRIEVGPLVALGRDNSDKGANKAMTQAFKYALLQVLCIGDGKSDGDGHDTPQADERRPPEPPPWPADLGWSPDDERVWRDSYTARAAALDDDRRRSLKSAATVAGMVWAKPIPKHVADESGRCIRGLDRRARSGAQDDACSVLRWVRIPVTRLPLPGEAVLVADATEFRRLSQLLDQGLTTLREQAVTAANEENAYRKLVAQTWLEAPPGDVRKGGLSEAQRTAWVQAKTADARHKRDIAEALKLAALEAVRSRRAQLSYHQTLLNAEREEAAFARTGPNQ